MTLYHSSDHFDGPHFDVTLRPVFLVGINWSHDIMGKHFAIHIGPLCLMWYRLPWDTGAASAGKSKAMSAYLKMARDKEEVK